MRVKVGHRRTSSEECLMLRDHVALVDPAEVHDHGSILAAVSASLRHLGCHASHQRAVSPACSVHEAGIYLRP